MSLEPGDTDSSQSRGGEPQGTHPFAPVNRVTFDRRELNRIFNSMDAWSPPANGAITPSTSFGPRRFLGVPPCH